MAELLRQFSPDYELRLMEDAVIRKSTIEDKLAVKDAHIRSIKQVCIKDYTQEQVDAWAQPAYDDDVWEKAINQEHHQVVEINGKIEGFCHSTVHEDGTGEILGLYLTPEAIRKGLGRTIAEQGLEYISAHKPRQIVVQATKTAKEFYKRLGFEAAKEITDHNVRGQNIGCYRMLLKQPSS